MNFYCLSSRLLLATITFILTFFSFGIKDAYSIDVGIERMLSPNQQKCGIQDSIIVTLRNYDSAPIDLLTEQITINLEIIEPGGLIIPFSNLAAELFLFPSGSPALIPAGGTVNLLFHFPPLAFSTPGLYQISISSFSVSGNDVNPLNDKLVTEFVYDITAPPVISADKTSICPNTPINLEVIGLTGLTQWQGSTDNGLTWQNETGPGSNNRQYTTTLSANKIFRAYICSDTSQTIAITVITAPHTISLISTNIICNGLSNGSIQVVVNGASANTSILWDHNPASGLTLATNLSPGLYSVTVIDNSNGCQVTDKVLITQPAPIKISTNLTEVTCHGGKDGKMDIFQPTGGTPPYSVSFAGAPITPPTTIDSLRAGFHQIYIVDGNGCELYETFNLKQPRDININFKIEHISCPGLTNGKVTANVSGGTTPYIYEWQHSQAAVSQTLEDLPPGNYTLTITDKKGCVKKASTTINNSKFNLTISSKDSDCKSNSTGSAKVVARDGARPYTYLWNTDSTTSEITGLSSGLYSVSVIDAKGCELNETVTVNRGSDGNNADFEVNHKGPIVNFIDQSKGSVEWFWDFGNGKSSTDKNPSVRYAKSGKYTVRLSITDASGCISNKTMNINVEDIYIPNVFSPNGDGNNDLFYIINNGFAEYKIDIFDRWGVKVWESTGPEVRWDGRTISGEALPQGVYYYKMVALATGEEDDFQMSGPIHLYR
jgi:large repetitive protein